MKLLKNGYYVLGFIILCLVSVAGTLNILSYQVYSNYSNSLVISDEVVEDDLISVTDSSYFDYKGANTTYPDSTVLKKELASIEGTNSYFLFFQAPKLLLWLLLMALLIGLSISFIVFSCFHFFYQLKASRAAHNIFKWTEICIISLMVLLISVTLYLISDNIITNNFLMSYTKILTKYRLFFQHPEEVLDVAMFVPSLASLLSLINIFVSLVLVIKVSEKIYQNPFDEDKSHTISEATTSFKTLKTSIDFHIMLIGGFIGGGILVNGISRLAIHEALCENSDCELIPIDFLYAYGLIFTVLLAIVYYPISEYYKRIVQQYLEDIRDDNLRKQKMEELSINHSSTDNLKNLLKLSTPLIASIVAEIFGYLS